MIPRVLTALPVYNEDRHLTEVLEEVRKHTHEILVVDDGSTDGTQELLSRERGVYVLRHEQNQGYGAALRLPSSTLSCAAWRCMNCVRSTSPCWY